jgi:hypothetical protein
MRNLTIGADPEVFFEKDGVIVSAYGLIPGTKQNPFPVKHGGVQVDGMAAEFNIVPSSDVSQFKLTINDTLSALRAMVPGYNTSSNCVNVYDTSYFESQPDDAKLLGCEADFNAYTLDCNRSPDTSFNPTMRTVAGHIHVGWTEGADLYDENHFIKCAEVAKQMDYFLGIPSLMLDNTPGSAQRRQMYGKAGTFRPKSYGMEYRVLSNFWIFNEKLQEWVFNQTKNAMLDLDAGVKWDSRGHGIAREIIDTNNVQVAEGWLYVNAPEFLL